MFADDPGDALREAKRVLTPQGRLAVALWAEKEINEFRHVVQALASVMPEPPAGDGPFALSEPGVLEKVIEDSGFEPVETRRLPAPFTFVDTDHYLRAVLGMAPGQSVLRQVDEETVTEALLAAGEEFRQDDGSYRFENTFQAVGAIPRDGR
jgi:SAM-dependent methyltransferase